MSTNQRHLAKNVISWASILDDATREQAIATGQMPFIHPHVALMPDAHLGKGATVGSVIPTVGAIIPAAIGVDIGCGMMALRTSLGAEDVAGLDLRALREAIEAVVPLSAGGYNELVSRTHTTERLHSLEESAASKDVDPAKYAGNWKLQLGTLGSGNHFIEVSLDEEDRVWLFLHSGSRGVGNKIAQHFIKIASDQCTRRFIPLPDPDLAYLVEHEPEFWDYMRSMMWAQEFALENRAEMMDRVLTEFIGWAAPLDVEVSTTINCHHNYTQQEKHFGKSVWLSRKGAIDAHEGVLGLVPGSMGTRSYVVEGLGNGVALCSSPHGAGRVFSRSKARKTFTHEQLREAMVGIEYRDTDAFVDEIPGAYKDIDVVMQDAAELVTIKHTLRQILNVKGD